MSEEKQYYGWFSELAVAESGTIYWTTPSGKAVEVTAVSTDPEYRDYHWKDKVMVGKVCNYSHQGRRRRRM